MGQQHDLVDAGGRHLVHAGLQARGQTVDVHLRAAQRRVEDEIAAGGDVAQDRRARADQADDLPADGHPRPAGDLAALRADVLAVGRDDGRGVAVGLEVGVVGQVGELRARPDDVAARDLRRHHLAEGARAQVQVVVAQRRGLHAHRVHEGDVAPAHALAADQLTQRPGVVRGVEARPRDHVVAGADQQGAIGVLGAELVHQRREVRHAAQRGRVGAVDVGEVQQLQGEGGRLAWGLGQRGAGPDGGAQADGKPCQPSAPWPRRCAGQGDAMQSAHEDSRRNEGLRAMSPGAPIVLRQRPADQRLRDRCNSGAGRSVSRSGRPPCCPRPRSPPAAAPCPSGSAMPGRISCLRG